MNFTYDLHIHSCLSPCANDDMTPYNLVNLAKLMQLDIIALTDHNSTKNCHATVTAGQKAGLVVIPGMELCTAEEIHIICLFGTTKNADAFGEAVYQTLPPIKNRPEIFGTQFVMDEFDNILDTEETLLSNASGISVDEVPVLCREYGGICYPAHIDRPSYSILAVFGMLDCTMGFTCAELTPQAKLAELSKHSPDLALMHKLYSSDAHALEILAAYTPANIDLPACTPQALIKSLAIPFAN